MLEEVVQNTWICPFIQIHIQGDWGLFLASDPSTIQAWWKTGG